jgi:hypothetical protein
MRGAWQGIGNAAKSKSDIKEVEDLESGLRAVMPG